LYRVGGPTQLTHKVVAATLAAPSLDAGLMCPLLAAATCTGRHQRRCCVPADATLGDVVVVSFL